MSNLTIKYNSSSVHIAGLDMKSVDNEYAMNACSALTRRGSRMLTAKTTEQETATAEQALKTAKSLALSIGKKVCKSCEAAALSMIDEQAAAPVFRFLVSLDEDNEETTVVEIAAGTRAEAKAQARRTPGALAVTSLN